METKYYVLSKIEGEYATLRDDKTKDELFIAMALLPMGVDIGSRLHYEMLTEHGVSDCHRMSFLKSFFEKK